MVKIFLIIAAVMLSILGLCEILHIACILVLRPKEKTKKILVIFPKKDCADEQIVLALHELSWHGESYADKIAVITDELSFEEKRNCAERFCDSRIIFAESFEELEKSKQRL